MSKNELEILSLLYARLGTFLSIDELSLTCGIDHFDTKAAVEDLFQRGYIHLDDYTCTLSLSGKTEAGSRWG